MADAFIVVRNQDRDVALPLLMQCDHGMREYRTHSSTHTVFCTGAQRVQNLSDPRVQLFLSQDALYDYLQKNGA